MPYDPRMAAGAARFNAGDFFTAHEIWEAAWLEAVGPEKERFQGLVQIAAGYAKVESGIGAGAIKLLTLGRQRLRQLLQGESDRVLQIFLDGVSADLERLERLPVTDVSLAAVRLPRCELG